MKIVKLRGKHVFLLDVKLHLKKKKNSPAPLYHLLQGHVSSAQPKDVL